MLAQKVKVVVKSGGLGDAHLGFIVSHGRAIGDQVSDETAIGMRPG
jgi:hypothetical protein